MWEPTGVGRIDYNPLRETSEFYQAILDDKIKGKGRKKNFIQFVAGSPEDLTYKKVRVNGKFDPQNTKVGLPQNMRDYRKTTVARHAHTGEWETIEERVPAEQVHEFEKDDDVDA